jgi:hypothetical protein
MKDAMRLRSKTDKTRNLEKERKVGTKSFLDVWFWHLIG